MSSFDLSSPDLFTAGAIGPPGQRVFHLQAREDDLVVSMRCEKQQVAALAEYFDGLLDDLEPTSYALSASDMRLVEPVEDLWVVGAIGVAYDEPNDRIVVVLEELAEVQEADEDDDDELDEDLGSGASVRVRLTRAQAHAFVHHTRELVAAGRPACRFCGLPIDPDGHACPRMN
jgi:uncharacterized repeat protein (TIGR03847 family)